MNEMLMDKILKSILHYTVRALFVLLCTVVIIALVVGTYVCHYTVGKIDRSIDISNQHIPFDNIRFC